VQLVIMVVAVVGVGLLAALSVLQVSLIAGAPLGRFAWGGQHVVLPVGLRIGSAVAVALYTAFALLMLQTAGAFSVLPRGLVAVAIWVLAVYFAIGVAVNAASPSRRERAVMTPVSLVLAVACLVLALH
jgi:hypothetical protein